MLPVPAPVDMLAFGGRWKPCHWVSPWGAHHVISGKTSSYRLESDLWLIQQNRLPTRWLRALRGASRAFHASRGPGIQHANACAPDVFSAGSLPTTALADIAEGPREASSPAVAHGASVEMYESPLCLEIDRLICTCEEAEDILRLLVSHRGALYVHNLVTAIKTLAEMATKGSPTGSVSGSGTQQQKQQEQDQQHQRSEKQQDDGGPVSPTARLLGARMADSQPPTWPRGGPSFVSFFSLLSQEEAQAERRNNRRNHGEDIVRDDRQAKKRGKAGTKT